MIGDNNNSFNDMKNLRAFYVNGSATPEYYTLKSNVLYDTDGTRLVSCPPMRQLTSIDLGNGVTAIGSKALANTQLFKVTMPRVSSIGYRAFYRSKITEAELPNTVTSIGRQTFMGAPRLATITINSQADLPEGFARECPALTTVKLNRLPGAIGAAAFKQCTKLASFPFHGAINFSADSIFSRSGLKEVKIAGTYTANTPAGRYLLGRRMFEGCASLTRIDLSGLKASTSADLSPIELSWGFANGCSSLRQLWLPEGTYFYPSSLAAGAFSARTLFSMSW